MAEQTALDFQGQDRKTANAYATRALASAEFLARQNDPSACMAFDDAERLAIKCSDQEIQMRVFESSGRYHERRGQAELAAEKYRMALKTAECLSVTSDEAAELVERLKWDLLRIENHKEQHFQNFIRAVQPSDTFQQGRKAWQDFVATKTNSYRPLAARGFGSVEDFRRRLDEARKSSSGEDEDEDVRW